MLKETTISLLNRADELKNIIDSSRPLHEAEVKSLREYFKIGLTYASNALEGNSLSITETKVLLEDGLTVGGKPIRDCFETIGHAKAYDFMWSVAKQQPFELTEQVIKRLHYLFYHSIDESNAGKYRDVQVFITGTEYYPPKPEDLPGIMQDFISDINSVRAEKHPVEWAALVHKRFVDIHPFVDGNGRTTRLLMNLVLISSGYTVTVIPPIRRQEYINALAISRREKSPSIDSFVSFIAECLIETEKDYCRMFRIPLT